MAVSGPLVLAVLREICVKRGKTFVCKCGEKRVEEQEKENIESRIEVAFETDGRRGNEDISFLGETEAVDRS